MAGTLLTTNGMMYAYAPITTVDTVPTTGWVVLTQVTDVPEVNLSSDTVSATPISETVSPWSAAGLSAEIGALAITSLYNDDAVDEFQDMVTAFEGSANGLCFTLIHPKVDTSYYYQGEPSTVLGQIAAASNNAATVGYSITYKKDMGRSTKPTI